MFNISGFLEKFKKFDHSKTLQNENIIRCIEKVIGVTVDKKNLEIKDGILRISGSPALRQEIFLKKEHLLPLIKAEGVFDIR
jgi:hypothetical protein